jgi:hypothetical protein
VRWGTGSFLKITSILRDYTLGWVDIATRTKVPLRFVTYLSKVSETDEKNVLKQ